MRIAKIELVGTTSAKGFRGTSTPRAFATLSRAAGSRLLQVVWLTPEGERDYSVEAGDRQALWTIAETLQHALDGYRGTKGDVQSVFSALEMLAD